MVIGWLVPTIGCFGAIREMIEVSNVLVRRGHQVSIYHPDGTECKWLTCLADCRKLGRLRRDFLDVLIGIIDWQPELYTYLLEADAKVKAVCLLGFNPSDSMVEALRGDRETKEEAEKIIKDSIKRKFLLLADSNWQVEWIKENVGYDAGPSFGGINLKMFKPGIEKRENGKLKIIYSGDPRERKGTGIVERAIELIKEDSSIDVEFDFYWGKRFGQTQLVNFIQEGDIFLDAHRRAGWCNPVAEAIACGTPPVCTHIGANRDFAIHDHTALKVPIDDSEAMARETIRLVKDKDLRHRLAMNGLELIKNFSYEVTTPILESALEKRLR